MIEKPTHGEQPRRLAGHQSASMTARYDLRPEDAKLAACEAVGLPYDKRKAIK